MPAPTAASSRTCWFAPTPSTAPAAAPGRRAELGLSYRHSEAPADWIFTGATLRGTAGDRASIAAAWPKSRRRARPRSRSAPRTGGSTFANPPGHKAWELIDEAGCRGLRRGGAMVSEKHTNFLINTGYATAADIEGLGEDVRRRVLRQLRRHARMGNPPHRRSARPPRWLPADAGEGGMNRSARRRRHRRRYPAPAAPARGAHAAARAICGLLPIVLVAGTLWRIHAEPHARRTGSAGAVGNRALAATAALGLVVNEINVEGRETTDIGDHHGGARGRARHADPRRQPEPGERSSSKPCPGCARRRSSAACRVPSSSASSSAARWRSGSMAES